MSTATGKVRAKPHVSPWGTKYAIQYQARTPSQGRLRLTGTSPRMTETTRMSLMVGARRRGFRARVPLFHRDALGEVARLVDIATPCHGYVIREKLEGDDRHQGRQELRCRGHDERVVRSADHLLIPSMADDDDTASPRLDLLHVSYHAVVAAVSRSESDHRHALIDERDGTMLHLPGGIALGVDVGDLFELERPFERDRVMDPAAQEEEVRVPGQFGGAGSHVGVRCERLGHQIRQLGQLCEPLLTVAGRQEGPAKSQRQREQIGGRDPWPE